MEDRSSTTIGLLLVGGGAGGAAVHVTVRQVAVTVACGGTGDNGGTILMGRRQTTSKSAKRLILHTSSARESSYLLTLSRPAHAGPIPGPHPHVVAAFGQSEWLVYSITRNGRVQVVAKETAGGGSHLLRRGVTVPPVLVGVVSNRRTSPETRENEVKHTLYPSFAPFKTAHKTETTN